MREFIEATEFLLRVASELNSGVAIEAQEHLRRIALWRAGIPLMPPLSGSEVTEDGPSKEQSWRE